VGVPSRNTSSVPGDLAGAVVELVVEVDGGVDQRQDDTVQISSASSWTSSSA
jgi:hypothetical protein